VSLTPTPLLFTSISMTALTTPRAHTQLTASLTHLASPEPKADGGNGQSNATAKLYDEYSVPHNAEQPSWHAAAAAHAGPRRLPTVAPSRAARRRRTGCKTSPKSCATTPRCW
jgi:hypothetical protein